MSELRYNPLLRDWTMVAANRQVRPDMPSGQCPFCPGSGKVPDEYEVFAYDNDFPVLSPHPETPGQPSQSLYRTRPAYGKCEVVLYSSNHQASLANLSLNQMEKVVSLWQQRYAALASDEQHQYILIFENRGREVGATIQHPHGQIYAYPFIPIKIRTELESAHQHHQVTGHCLLCDITQAEMEDGARMLVENRHFVSFIPYFTDFPYGAWIAPKVHIPDIRSFTGEEIRSLAEILSALTAGMDELFEREFPYMMVLHQTPVHRPDTSLYYHFHIEFYPPLRTRDKIKFLSSSETGAGAAANPASVEMTAVELREAIQKAQRRRADQF
ncbi:galactose-1-phosphate uridylyltransferase [Alicyclobacillus sp. TC]|uniref:Galactose-1-phosphate uridylyltransferase n=3 Tax=Alicyclobacillus tolerans TaxID=90970 RepID=A0ABT9LXX1_9BACL|nr:MULTISPECIES: galactose-1-phosphate uridylyltransferase [Alicyclobacillus]MDP9729105.1 UDPglucose--hexose-1-phosphate uridylyltransferase [Alicyclobacillus tengchongensis]QRF24199.1 galactose-1-phosphate uridylyltransferase [Alicyclobacillus sp. TC]